MAQQERAARTRQSLIRAAAEVFAQDGFAPASLAAISRRAGVSNGALHFHFMNKDALAKAVEGEAALILDGITGKAMQDGKDALQALVDATRRLLSRLAEDVVLRAGFQLCVDAARGDGAGLKAAWQQWSESALHEAERQGLLAERMSAATVAPTVVAATVGFVVLGAKDPMWLSQEQLACFWDLLLPRLTEADRAPC